MADDETFLKCAMDKSILSSLFKEAVQNATNEDFDVVIVSEDGHKVKSHRALLCLFSPFLKDLLSLVPCCITPSVSIPASLETINNLIKLLSTGLAVSSDKDDLDRVKEVANLVKIDLDGFNIDEKKKKTSDMITVEVNGAEDVRKLLIMEEEKSDDGIEDDEIEVGDTEENNYAIACNTEENNYANSSNTEENKYANSSNTEENKYAVACTTEDSNYDDIIEVPFEDTEVKHVEYWDESAYGDVGQYDQDGAPITLDEDGKALHSCFCGKVFKRIDHLKRHMANHTGEKPFACDLCGKCFSRKDKMKHHRTVHGQFAEAIPYHEPAVEPKYFCHVCGEGYNNRVKLAKHVRTHSWENQGWTYT